MFPFLESIAATQLGQILAIVLGVVVLWAGAEGMVKGASQLALRLGMRPMLVGATVVAFGTSAPEWVVSVFSEQHGAPNMALTNIIGSNVANLTIVLGLAAAIIVLPVRSRTLRQELPFVLIGELLFVALVYDGSLSTLDGVWLFACFLILYLILFRRRAESSVDTETPDAGIRYSIPKDLVLIVIGLLGLTMGAESFTIGARSLGQSFGISDRVLGATVVAFGTSLPELVTAVVGAMRGHTEISLGNLLGSNLFNILFVGGSLAFVGGEIAVSPKLLYDECVWMLAVTIVFWPLVVFRRKGLAVGRGAGILLALSWVLFISLSLTRN